MKNKFIKYKGYIISIAVIVICGIGVQVWIHYDKSKIQPVSIELKEQEQTTEDKPIEDISKPIEMTEENIIKDDEKEQPKEEDIEIPDIEPPQIIEKKTFPKDTQIVTENEDGTVDIEIHKPQFDKPTIKDEDQLTNPEKEPEYDVPTIKDEPNKPTGGETNSKGEIYVPGFGWMKDNSDTNTQDVAENAGTGEDIGIMG